MRRTEAALQRVAVFGATSGIIGPTLVLLARGGCRLVLVGRDPKALEDLGKTLGMAGAGKIATLVSDLGQESGLQELVDEAWNQYGGLDAAVLAQGVMPDQELCEADPGASMPCIRVNYVSSVLLALGLASRFEAQGGGCLAVFSSVAGERGRLSNYVYGSTKAGMTCFLEGLRARLRTRGVRVVTFLPGPVETKMTAKVRKGLLWSSPERLGPAIVYALRSRSGSVFLPGRWRPLVWLLKVLPETIVSRMR